MKKIISFSVVFLLLVSSCKKQKELPEPEVNDPHFYLNCSMDGQPLNIVAGNDDYYMNSSWYHQDSENVYVYKANLAKQSNSGYQVTILFNETQTSTASDLMRVDSNLIVGDRLYNDNIINGTTQNLKFTPIKQSSGSTYSWSYTDGVNVSYGGSGIAYYPYPATLDVNKTYSVTLNYNDGSGVCSETFTNVYRVGNKLQTDIVVAKMNSSELKYQFTYKAVNSMYKNLKCTWQFSNGIGSSDNSPMTTKVFQQNTSTYIKLNLTDALIGDSCIAYYKLNATNNSVCEANFTTEFSDVKNIRMPSSVTVLLTDPNGVVYSSKLLTQPKTSNFQVTEVADYKQNEKGQSTKSLKVKFNCVVKNGSTEIILKDGEAKVAVAYK